VCVCLCRCLSLVRGLAVAPRFEALVSSSLPPSLPPFFELSLFLILD
jgi:hypothetical protein